MQMNLNRMSLHRRSTVVSFISLMLVFQSHIVTTVGQVSTKVDRTADGFTCSDQPEEDINECAVNTSSGYVHGIYNDFLRVTSYLGIPYAEPPIGELRFKPPLRKKRMKGIYSATNNDFVCPQIPSRIISYTFPKGQQTEDCLRLDVYVPDSAKQQRLPVMVWVHGGAFLWGNSKTYDGSQMAGQNNVIVVSLNYRLGILGFLNTMDEHVVGNFGLRDQCAAIEWVVDNIREFGGDSSRVTLFGESAGSASIMQMAMSSLCLGKFQRVIGQSGNPYDSWSHNRDPVASARNLALALNCPLESEELVNCLKLKSWEELVLQQSTSFAANAPLWVPSYSGDVFPENPVNIVHDDRSSAALNRFRSVDLMLGVNNEESEGYFLSIVAGVFLVFHEINKTEAVLTDIMFDNNIRQSLKTITTNSKEIEALLPVVKFLYTDWESKKDAFSNTKMYIKLLGDLGSHVNSVLTSRLHSGWPGDNRDTCYKKGKTFFYRFKPKASWLISYPWTEGATHTDELEFVFGYVKSLNSTDGEKALSCAMMEYWTNFARTGTPNYPSQRYLNTTWPTYDIMEERFLNLDVNMTPHTASTRPYGRRFAFWTDVVPSFLRAMRENVNKTLTSGHKDFTLKK